jgi:hypothetical protein
MSMTSVQYIREVMLKRDKVPSFDLGFPRFH